ncbi:MAG: ABC transporter ATP-binding protein [Pseudomonadota bacterium]
MTLTLEGITKRFDKTPVLHGIDLGVAEGEFHVFVGPSGCGKSTLLRMIAGLEDPTEGRVLIGGEDVTAKPPAKRGIAMVFQSYALYPHLDAAANMALGLRQEGQPKAAIQARIAEAARMLSLEDLLDRRPATLSGGQRQRVAIGRAIVREPRLFLFDEPLSNLDAALRSSMRMELAALHAALGATMVYVTHDQIEAMTLAHRITVLNEGRIEQQGTPMEFYNTPANRFVAGFFGTPPMNFLPADIVGGPGGQTLGLRPEHLYPDQEGRLTGPITHVERLGSDTHAILDVHGQSVVMRMVGQHDLSPGQAISVTWNDSDAHRFGSDGKRLPT